MITPKGLNEEPVSSNIFEFPKSYTKKLSKKWTYSGKNLLLSI